MAIFPIHTEEDYEAACRRIDEIFQAEPGSGDAAELDALVTLVEAYDEKRLNIGMPHPIDAIKIQMQALDVSRKDLGEWLGKSSGRISDLLNCRRHLTLDAIRILSHKLHIPIEVLSQDYSIHATTHISNPESSCSAVI